MTRRAIFTAPLRDIPHHFIDTHVQPATSSTRILLPRFLSYMASWDVASDIWRALLGGPRGGPRDRPLQSKAVQVDSIKTHVESAYGFSA